MRIFINALSATLGGGITVLKQLLPAMLEEDGGVHEYLVLARDCQAIDPGNRRARMIPVSAQQGSAGRLFSEQVSLPRMLLSERADVLLCPANVAVAACPVPQVLIFQNVAPFTPEVLSQYRGTSTGWRLELLRRISIFSAKVADEVVFISDSQRSRILPSLGIRGRRGPRIYLGQAAGFTPEAIAKAPQILAGLAIARPYVLSVSHFYRYQNLIELVRGFAVAIPSLPKEITLVLAGSETDSAYAGEVRKEASDAGITQRIRWVGHVPYTDLPALYAAAAMFAFATTCESFPNTLIEAMSCGVPVLASNIGPMPELGGNGARYFSPDSSEDIGRALAALWNDVPGRAALAAAGIARAGEFSWRSTARELLSVLRETASREPSRFRRLLRVLWS